MPNYRLRWEIDIEAATPIEAAEKALAAQRKPDGIATIFDVWERTLSGQPIQDTKTTVDLMPDDAPLFCGVYPNGLQWADRRRTVCGDYVTVAFLFFDTLNLRIEPDCPAVFREVITHAAAAIQARRGEAYSISACNQTVILGSACAEPNVAVPA